LVRRLAELTNSDPFLWMWGGGTPEERQVVIEAWAEPQDDDAQDAVTDD